MSASYAAMNGSRSAVTALRCPPAVENQLGYKMVKWDERIEFIASEKNCLEREKAAANEDDEDFDLPAQHLMRFESADRTHGPRSYPVTCCHVSGWILACEALSADDWYGQPMAA